VIAKPSPSLPVTWCRWVPKLAALKTAYRMEATGRERRRKSEGSSGAIRLIVENRVCLTHPNPLSPLEVS
jgi:hypothetical protein